MEITILSRPTIGSPQKLLAQNSAGRVHATCKVLEETQTHFNQPLTRACRLGRCAISHWEYMVTTCSIVLLLLWNLRWVQKSQQVDYVIDLLEIRCHSAWDDFLLALFFFANFCGSFRKPSHAGSVLLPDRIGKCGDIFYCSGLCDGRIFDTSYRHVWKTTHA